MHGFLFCFRVHGKDRTDGVTLRIARNAASASRGGPRNNVIYTTEA